MVFSIFLNLNSMWVLSKTQPNALDLEPQVTAKNLKTRPFRSFKHLRFGIFPSLVLYPSLPKRNESRNPWNPSNRNPKKPFNVAILLLLSPSLRDVVGYVAWLDFKFRLQTPHFVRVTVFSYFIEFLSHFILIFISCYFHLIVIRV